MDKEIVTDNLKFPFADWPSDISLVEQKAARRRAPRRSSAASKDKGKQEKPATSD